MYRVVVKWLMIVAKEDGGAGQAGQEPRCRDQSSFPNLPERIESRRSRHCQTCPPSPSTYDTMLWPVVHKVEDTEVDLSACRQRNLRLKQGGYGAGLAATEPN